MEEGPCTKAGEESPLQPSYVTIQSLQTSDENPRALHELRDLAPCMRLFGIIFLTVCAERTVTSLNKEDSASEGSTQALVGLLGGAGEPRMNGA
jgi:hypothetical protein